MHTVRSLRLKRGFYVVILLIRINFWVYIWGLHETNNLIHMIEWNTYGYPLKFWIYLKLIFKGNLKKKIRSHHGFYGLKCQFFTPGR